MAQGLRWLLLGDPVKPRPEPKAAPPPRRPARRSFGFEQFSDGFENIPAGARKVIDAVTGRSAAPLPRTGEADAFEPATRPLVSLSGQEPLLPLVDEPELPPPPAADGFFVASLDDLVLPEVVAPAPGEGGSPAEAGQVGAVEQASAAAPEATPTREPSGEVPVTTPPLAMPEAAGVLMAEPRSSSTAVSSAGSGAPGPEAGEGAVRPATSDLVVSVGVSSADLDPGEVRTPSAPHLEGQTVAGHDGQGLLASGWAAPAADLGGGTRAPVGDTNRLHPPDARTPVPLEIGLAVPAEGADGAQSLPVGAAVALDGDTSISVPGGGANRLNPPDAGAPAPLEIGLAVPANGANGAQSLPVVAAASDAGPASVIPGHQSPEPPRPDGAASAGGLGDVRLAQPDPNWAALDAGPGSATPTSASVESLAAATVDSSALAGTPDSAATLLHGGREAVPDEPLGTGAPPPDLQRDSPVPTREAPGPASAALAEPADREFELPAAFLSLAFRVDRDRAPKPAQPPALPPADFLADVSDLGVLAEPAPEAPAPAAPAPPPSKPDGEPPTS